VSLVQCIADALHGWCIAVPGASAGALGYGSIWWCIMSLVDLLVHLLVHCIAGGVAGASHGWCIAVPGASAGALHYWCICCSFVH
jgi:hypothetical protein